MNSSVRLGLKTFGWGMGIIIIGVIVSISLVFIKIVVPGFWEFLTGSGL